jgi:hypothetical protein
MIGAVCNGSFRTRQPPSFACEIASAASNSADSTVPNRCQPCCRAATNDALPSDQVSNS